MVQVTFDTNNDSLEELEHTILILQKAIEKHTSVNAAKINAAKENYKTPEQIIENRKEEKKEDEKEEDDTPFIKITIKHEDTDDENNKKDEWKKKSDDKHESESKDEHQKNAPTLNQLINDASITEEELSSLFKGPIETKTIPENIEPKLHSNNTKEKIDDNKSYLEIIEYSEEEK